MIGRALERWVAFQVRGKIERKPPQRTDTSRGPARDRHYRAWIRTLPCAACGRIENIEAAHTGPHGLSQKASDYACIPLCIGHHRTGKEALDRIGRQQFERQFGLTVSALTRRLNRIWFEARRLAC